MNTTVSINLDQRSYILDEAAYDTLKSYLHDIQLHFGEDEDGKEIVQDIESRIAELCSSKLSDHKNVIGLADVESIITEMGSVADITGQDDSSSNTDDSVSDDTSEHTTTKKSSWHPGKKLMRDTELGVVAGVCSGIGAYFGIDPTIVRILFIVLVLAGLGSPILIYIVLWIAMPEAKTASDKLQMRGEPVTVAGIQQSVKEAVDPNTVEASKNAFQRFMGSIWQIARQIFEALKQVLMAVFPIIGKIIGLIVVVITTGWMVLVTVITSQILWFSDSLPSQFALYTPWLQAFDLVPGGAKVALVVSSAIAILLALLLIFFWGLALLLQRHVLPTVIGVSILLLCVISASLAGSIGLRYGDPVVSRLMEIEQTYEQNLPSAVLPVEGVYTAVSVADGVRTEIVYGEKAEVKVVGPDQYQKDVQVSVVDGELQVRLSKHFFWGWCINCSLPGVKVVVTMPEVTDITATGGSRAAIDTWPTTMASLDLTAKGGARIISGEFPIAALATNVDGGARIELHNAINVLQADVDGGARLQALEATIQAADIVVGGGASAELNVIKRLDATVKGGARLEYSGTPEITQKVSGGATIQSVEELELEVEPESAFDEVPTIEPAVQPAVQ